MTETESGLVAHARVELEAIGAFDKDKDFYGGMTGNAVLELVCVFAAQGHSGMSASLVRSLFAKVAAYEPLCPITGADSEWFEVSDGVWQNRRCSHVFKGADGVAYDIQGRVFRNKKNGHSYTNIDSRVPVTFPYTPKSEVVDVDE